MNTKALASNYDALTAAERASLMLAAILRGDQVEADRLARTAPQIHLSATDCWPIMRGFIHLAYIVLAELLGYAAQIGQLRSLVVQILVSEADGPKPSEEAELLADYSHLLVARFLRTLDAWERFCQARAMPSRGFWQTQPGFDALTMAELIYRGQQKPPKEMALLAARLGTELESEEEMVQELDEAMQQWEALM